MDSFGLLLGGIQAILTPQTLLLLALGAFLGMVVGVLPGIGPSAGIAILLPLTFGAEPVAAVAMLAAIYYGSMYGGTITSVLINTPGESATVVTTFDGYPLAKKGRAGAVLVMCAVGSLIAGTVAAIGMTFFTPALGDAARSLGPSEMFLILVLGLLMIVLIVGGNPLYGIISALVGFAVATVGVDLVTGGQRFTFGSTDLISGIDFLPIAIGLFGIGEVLHSIYQGAHRKDYEFMDLSIRGKGFWPTKAEWRQTPGPIARGSGVGFVTGILPGAGATISTFVSYVVERTVSKRPSDFGKGKVAGVVGPESANNASSVSSMIPVLALGIPGSGATAVLLGGFLLWGLRPGPLLMTENPEFAWGLIGSMYIGNVILVVLSIAAIPLFASFMKVPYRVTAPIIVLLCILGVYALNASFVELGIMLVAGVVGMYMKIYGFSPAALVLAVVLGPLAETTLRQALLSGGSMQVFVDRPVSLALLTIIALFIATVTVLRVGLRRRGVKLAESDE